MDQYWNQVYHYYRRLGHADANARALTAQALQRAGHAATTAAPALAPAPAPAPASAPGAQRHPVTTGGGASRNSNYAAGALAAAAVFAASQRQVTGGAPGARGSAPAAEPRQAAPAPDRAAGGLAAVAAVAPVAGAQQASAAATAYATHQAEAAARLVQMHQEQVERARRDWETRQKQLREREQEAQQHQEAAQVHEEGNADDEGGEVDIYEQYQPAKVREGPPHPDPIVETASLASVTPPDIIYKHHLQDNLTRAELSNAQLETVLYAFQRFGRRLPDGARAGFFLGDGAGVGKGRQIAAVIKEFWATGGRRVLWVSTSNDLRYDARRDLGDLGVAEDDIPVYPPRKDNVPSGSLASAYPGGGVLFVTYSLLVSKGSYKPPPGPRGRGGARSGGASGGVNGRGRGRGRRAGGDPGAAAAAAATADDMAQAPSALELKRAEVRRLFGAGSRLHQIVSWLGGEGGGGDCLIILDECHKAKNLLDAAGNSSQTGLAVEALQDQLPNARVLYSSATGASEPDNLRYMVRLGAFDYPHISDMINALKRSGLGALEMFCMGLKATGTYVSRTLSYKGAEFITEELEPDPVFRVMYDRSCRLWGLLWNVMRQLPRAAAKNRGGRDSKAALFWSAHQRFYRQMLIASKVKRCAELAAEALRRGMCVVVGLQSTGEANLAAAREVLATGLGEGGGAGAGEEDTEDFVSAPRMIMHNFISQWLFHFTVPVGTLMDKRTMQKLQAEIYRVCVEWRQLPSCEEEAMTMVKQEKRMAAVEATRLAREERATAAAAAAAGASPASAAAAGAAATEAAMSAYGAARPPGRRIRYDEKEQEEWEREGARARAQEQARAPGAMDVDEPGAGLAAAVRAGSGDVEMTDADAAAGSAGVAGTSAAPANGMHAEVAAAMAAAAAGATAAAAQQEPEESDEDDVVVEGERTLDQVLSERRRLAILAGDLIDLADDTDDEAAGADAGPGGAAGATGWAGTGAYGAAGAPAAAVQGMRAQRDAERRRLLEQADAEEAAAAAAAETRRQEERRAKLQTAVAEARSLLDDLQKQVKELETAEAAAAAGANSRGGTPAPALTATPAPCKEVGGTKRGKAGNDVAGGEPDSRGGSTLEGVAELEDDVAGNDEEDARRVRARRETGGAAGPSGRGAKAPAKGRRRGAAILDDEEDQAEDAEPAPGNGKGKAASKSTASLKAALKTAGGKAGATASAASDAVGAAAAAGAEAASPVRADDGALRPRRAAQQAAARIDAINRGGPMPPKPPRGPSALPAKTAAAVMGVAVAVKREAGQAAAAKPVAPGAAAGAAPAGAQESDSVIIIEDSSEEDEDAGTGTGPSALPAAPVSRKQGSQPSPQAAPPDTAAAVAAPAAAPAVGAGGAVAGGVAAEDDDASSIGEEISNPDESEYQPASGLEDGTEQLPPAAAEKPAPQQQQVQQAAPQQLQVQQAAEAMVLAQPLEGGEQPAPDAVPQQPDTEPAPQARDTTAQAKTRGQAESVEEQGEAEAEDGDVEATEGDAELGEEDQDDEEEEEDAEDESEGYDDTLCAVCAGGDDPDTILLCDTCDEGYHMGCLDPPLEEIPDGDWHCPKCTAADAAKAAAAADAAMAAAAPAASAGAKRKLRDSEHSAAAGAVEGAAAAAATAAAATAPAKLDHIEAADSGKRVGGAHHLKRQKTAALDSSAAGTIANGTTNGKPAARGGTRRAAAVVSVAEARGTDQADEQAESSISSHVTASEHAKEEEEDATTRGKRGGRLTKGAVVVGTGKGRGAGAGAGGGARGGAAGKRRGQGNGGKARRRGGKPASDGEQDTASSSASDAEGVEEDAPAAAKGAATAAPAANPAVGKIRMQLRIARQRLKDAAARAAAAERDLEHFTRALAAAAAAAANGSGRRSRTRSRSVTADGEEESGEDAKQAEKSKSKGQKGRKKPAKRASGGKATANRKGTGKPRATASSSSSSAASDDDDTSEDESAEEASDSESEEASESAEVTSSSGSSSADEAACSDKDAEAQDQPLPPQPDPTKYRHAAKAKPLGKLPGSWAATGDAAAAGGSRRKGAQAAAGGGKGKKKAAKGGGRWRRRAAGDGDSGNSSAEADEDSSSDSDDSDDSSVSLVTSEEEGEGGGEGDADHSDGGVELIDEEEERMRERRRTRRRGGGGGGEAGAQEAGGAALPPELRKCRAMLLRLLEAQELPLNPLDQLLELLGGPDAVAEMTGRKVAQVRNEETGRVVCVQRRDDEAQKMVNMAEKDDFMSGRKLVAVISDAASTGISLQADRRVANQRRRFHITLELPWSADKAIQQFGRSHRSNQASAPEYCLLVTKCGGEYRFAGAVAKRLTSLGALLRGDRRALGASSDLKPYDVDNRYGEAAVQRVLECVANGVHTVAGSKVGELPGDLLPPDAAAAPPGSLVRQRTFLAHMQRCLRSMGLLTATHHPGGHVVYSVERKDQATGVPKFLNRLLGLPLRDQDLLFGYFLGIMDALVKQARFAGDYDEAIVNIGHSAVKVVAQHQVHVDAPSGATTHYVELDVDDGLSWPDACAALAAALEDMAAERAPARIVNKVGFYVARRNANVGGTGHPLVVLATAMRQTVLGSRLAPRFRIQRPNQVKGYTFTLHELEDKYRKVDEQTAELHWAFWYAYLDTGCLHGGECVRRKRDGRCNYGSRFYRLHLVTGAVLPVLRKLFDTVLRGGGGGPSGKKQAPRVIRATIREQPEVQGQQGAAAGGQLLLEGPAEAVEAREQAGVVPPQAESGDDGDVVEVVEVAAPVKREGARARERNRQAPRQATGSTAAAGGSAGTGPSGSSDPGVAAAAIGSTAGAAAAAVPGGHAHAGVAGEGGHDPSTRVVVGLSLTERDAEQFLQSVVM